MIESRYKIEYELPEEDVNKTSPFRVLWYWLLIPLVVLVVGAITYDFSIRDISRDSFTLLEKAKVHILNLGDEAQLKELEEQNALTSKKPEESEPLQTKAELPKTELSTTEQSTKVIKAQTLPKTVETLTVETEEKALENDKITIVELTTAQELQLKSIQEQIAQNTQLTSRLNKLSEQLVFEKNKNESLNSRIAEQEQDRLELEEQFYNRSEPSEGDVTNKDEPAISKSQNITLKSPKAVEPIEVKPPVMSPKVTDVVEAIKTEEKIEKSDTDKIIEAMATITTPTKTLAETNPSNDLPEDVIISKESDITNNENKEDKSLSVIFIQEKITEPSTDKTSAVKTSTEKTIVDTVEDKTAEKLKADVAPIEPVTTTLSVKDDTKLQDSSSVDAIIAAMKGVKSDVTEKTVNKSQNTK